MNGLSAGLCRLQAGGAELEVVVGPAVTGGVEAGLSLDGQPR
jgi:hypothetical protein